MLEIKRIIAEEFSLNFANVNNTLELSIEGATVPFIARYRKEKTGSLDEVQIRDIWERYTYLMELEARKATILESIAAQNKLTDALQQKIASCLQKTELEDLYLPFKPKRRTKATIAKEKGLEPLAEYIQSVNIPQVDRVDLESVASKYLSEDKGVKTTADALAGARDILAEIVAEKAELRSHLRELLLKEGLFVARIEDEHPEGSTKYEIYRDYRTSIKKIAPHSLLALLRGEAEGIISLELEFNKDKIFADLESREIKTRVSQLKEFLRGMLKDAFKRLIFPALEREIRNDRKADADRESIETFASNLRELLLAPPAGMKPTMAIDPGFRTGCKLAILSITGQFLEYKAIFPHSGDKQRLEATNTVKHFLDKYKIELIAIGNGTASRETDEFIAEVISNNPNKPIKVIVNESGASIYSASDLARAEFPDLDVTVRGAISIGRRLQDPLAELVKIDAKSIGVGQYQHDVDQKLLKQKLEETVESCVNYVGVDLNTASKELLTFVSGVTPSIANNIINYRNEKGAFKNRQELLKVSKLGVKVFEQAAGFLRIRNGDNPLDNTAVHPESYPVVRQIAAALKIDLNNIVRAGTQLRDVDLKQFASETVGLPTLRDAIEELEKPGRDPRDKFQYAKFQEGINAIGDLKVGMELEGVITNVVNFGAFVDIGVHQDGLIHISQIADRFVSDPKDIVKVGQIVKVIVLEVNDKLQRISLSMRRNNPK
jgi:protein Tex